MLQLYKSRDFGQFFKDTFDFLKTHGKHFFKNYLTVNGVVLVTLTVITYLFNLKFQSGSPLGLSSLPYTYEENTGVLFLYILLYLIAMVVLGMYVYAYVPIYFKLYEKHHGANFGAKEIYSELSKNASKLFKFVLAGILVAIPVMIVVGIIAFILSITIIGIPLLLFLIAHLSFFYHTTLMEYIKSEEKGIFECFGYSAEMCFQKFFPTIGALGIFFLIAIIIQSGFALIQYIFLFIMGVVSLDNFDAMYDIEGWSFVFIVVSILEIISYIINFIISTVMQVNHAIVYYGLKEEKENIHTQFTIDEIGSAKD